MKLFRNNLSLFQYLLLNILQMLYDFNHLDHANMTYKEHLFLIVHNVF